MVTVRFRPSLVLAAVVLAALGGCEETFEPDMELARAVRAGEVEACVRGAERLPHALAQAVWNTYRHGELMTGVVPQPVVRLTDTPRLTGSTPGEAVFCTVSIAIDDPPGSRTAVQAYEISLGNDLGRDFADLNLRDAVGVGLYSEASKLITGGDAVWDPSDLACSRRNPRALLSDPIPSATARTMVARWRSAAAHREISLPEWTRSIGNAAGGARQAVDSPTASPLSASVIRAAAITARPPWCSTPPIPRTNPPAC